MRGSVMYGYGSTSKSVPCGAELESGPFSPRICSESNGFPKAKADGAFLDIGVIPRLEAFSSVFDGAHVAVFAKEIA